jgi:cyanate permease
LSAAFASVAALAVPADSWHGKLRMPIVPRRSKSLLGLLCFAVAGGLGAAAGNALGGFLVTVAVTSGWTEKAAAQLLIQGSLAGLGVRLLVGWIANQQYRRSLHFLTLLLCLGALGFGLLALNRSTTWTMGTLIAFGAGWGWSGVFHLAVVLVNSEAPARATGLTQAGTFAGAAIGPFVFGLMAEHASFSNAWWLAALWQIIAAGLVVANWRSFSYRPEQNDNSDAITTV